MAEIELKRCVGCGCTMSRTEPQPCAGCRDEDDPREKPEDHGEAEMLAGMAHGNRGLAEYGGLETDRPGGTGCYGCGGRGCEDCNWGES